MKVVSNNLALRGVYQYCDNGQCSLPRINETCTQKCDQAPGDSRKTRCTLYLDGTARCEPTCISDAQCPSSGLFDQANANPPEMSTFCVNYGGLAACMPQLCFIPNQPPLDSPSLLYAPCQGYPNSLCLPQYIADASEVLGVCQSVRPGSAPTVGEPCDMTAGQGNQAGLCGADAICQGGVCQKICDAVQGGTANFPGCDPTQVCVPEQGVNLVAGYQVGACGNTCDPLADEANSGCTTFCGGPPSRCNLIFGDPSPGEPYGYCASAASAPLPTGSACTQALIDPCETGSGCIGDGQGNFQCIKFCNGSAAAGSVDACPSGQHCNLFQGLNKLGYCQ